MRKSILGVGIKIIVFSMGLFLTGCASNPVPTYLPANHPAHPDAAEVVHKATPNPFQSGMSMNKMKPNVAPEIPPEEHEAHNSHPMSSGDEGHEKSDRHHKEHD